MPQIKHARTERAILKEIRELGDKVLRPDTSIDRQILARADRVLWEAYEAGVFGRDRVVERLAKAHRLRAADSPQGCPAHYGFAKRMARDWFPAVFNCYGELAGYYEFDSTPTDDHRGQFYRDMLQMIPSLRRPLSETEKKAFDHICANPGQPAKSAAKAAGITLGHFNSRIAQRMRDWGCENNNNGDGWFGPTLR